MVQKWLPSEFVRSDQRRTSVSFRVEPTTMQTARTDLDLSSCGVGFLVDVLRPPPASCQAAQRPNVSAERKSDGEKSVVGHGDLELPKAWRLADGASRRQESAGAKQARLQDAWRRIHALDWNLWSRSIDQFCWGESAGGLRRSERDGKFLWRAGHGPRQNVWRTTVSPYPWSRPVDHCFHVADRGAPCEIGRAHV